MHAAEFFDTFKKNIMSDPSFYYKDYLNVKQKVDNSSAIYKGKPVKFLYQPMFFTPEDINRFENLTSSLTNILNTIIDEYLKNPDFRKEFGFPPLMEELVMVDQGYSIKFPMARYDIFYHYNNSFKFCELNADGSSSMNESRVLHEIIYNSNALNKIRDRYNVFDFELFDSWIDAVISNYIEFNSGKNDNPNIAIMDFEGEGIVSEFEVFKKRFEQRGYHTVICDPRELKYANGRLYLNNNRIDLIYRRATTARLIDEAESIQDFIKAYKDRAVCVVGGLVSQIIHNKKLFAILHSESIQPLLDIKEREFIRNHIPWTVVLNPDNMELMDKLISNKDQLVLKPFDSFAAHGVYIGKDYTFKEWKKLIEQAIKQPYLVQELCNIPSMDMLTVEEGNIYFEKYNYIIGLFMYNQQFKGLYTRAGRKNVIASIVESFSLPNFIIENQ